MIRFGQLGFFSQVSSGKNGPWNKSGFQQKRRRKWLLGMPKTALAATIPNSIQKR